MSNKQSAHFAFALDELIREEERESGGMWLGQFAVVIVVVVV